MSISCQHRCLVIPRLHFRHRDVDDIVSTSVPCHRWSAIYLVYIVHIVDIAMLTISYRQRVDIGTLSYLVNIVDIAMLTISYRHCVDIGTLSYLVYIVYIVDVNISYRHRVDISTSTSCRHRYPVIYERNFTLCVLLVYNDNGSVKTLCIAHVSALWTKCLHIDITSFYTKVYLHCFYVYGLHFINRSL